MGLSSISINSPLCLVVDVAHDGLPARIYVDVLYSHSLFAAAPKLGEGLSLRSVRPQ
jgi:hypothetical protein